MKEFKSLNGYPVKDSKAREDIENILDVQNGLKNNLSNPNLLINSDFRRTINQRGKASYTTTNKFMYTVDRWYIANNVTLESLTGYVKLTLNSEGVGYMLQVLETPLPFDDYTIKVNVKNVSGNAFIRCQDKNYVNLSVDLPLNTGVNTYTVKGDIERVGVYLTSGSIEVEYITDMAKVTEYGVMSMPAIVVNEKVVSAGKVLSEKEITKILGGIING